MTLDISNPRAGTASTLQLRNLDLPAASQACLALPDATALATPPVQLLLRAGTHEQTITLPSLWRCHPDRRGNLDALSPITPKPPVARRGLQISIHGPRTAIAGSTVSYRVTVHNQRAQPRDRLVSSLWNLRVIAGARGRQEHQREINELRRRRARTLSLAIRLPRGHLKHYCVTTAATADSARGAQAHFCTQLTTVTPPPVGRG